MYINTYRVRNSYPPTAIRLAEELGWEITNFTNLPITHTPTVNWGINVNNAGEFHREVLNRYAPIDKATAFQLFKENNVSSPRFMLGPVVRRRLRHSQGRDIVRYDTNYFFVEEIPKVREFRVECFRGTDGVMAAFRGHIKTPLHPIPHQPFNWNRENTEWQSHGYRTIRGALGDECLDLAKQAVEALQYDFGAVDIIQDESGRYYVLEVNSAPHLDDNGIAKYAYRIQRWVNECL